MNALKQLCVVVVLSAVGYAGYRTLTGKQDGEPPPEAAGWENGPQVQLPDLLPPPLTNPTTTTPASTPTPTNSASTTIAPTATAAPTTLVVTPPAPATPAEPYATTMPAPTMTPTAEPKPLDTTAAPLTPPTAMTAPSASSPYSASPSTSTGPTATLTSTGIDVTPGAPADAAAEFPAAMATTQTLLAQNKLPEALQSLSEWYFNPALSPTERGQLQNLLDQLAGTVVYSTQHMLEPVYVVQGGDTLAQVAERYSVSPQLLMKINGLASAEAIKPGDQLKVVRGPFDAVITMQNFEMTLFLRGRYAGKFRVGAGVDQEIKAGEFEVRSKAPNPPYAPPGQQPVAAGDPANPLGSKWIDLGGQLGIHGTNDPQSLGRIDSKGSIRLGPADIEDVYDILTVGSRVVIHR